MENNKENSKLTQENFIEISSLKHDCWYSYYNTTYTGKTKKVVITCPIHGDFKQRADLHMRGHGCIKCASIKRSNARRLTKETFIKRSKDIHGDVFSYRNVVFKGVDAKVEIGCIYHGPFWQTPSNHMNGHGCPECGIDRVKAYSIKKAINKRPTLSNIRVEPGTRVIPVGTQGEYALVDDTDYVRVSKYSWYKNNYGYAVNNTVGLMHRFIIGVRDKHVQLDHKDCNKLNNKRDNLRQCTQQQNNFNIPARTYGQSKYKGVYLNRTNGRWFSRVMGVHLGMFDTEEEAAIAYDKAAKVLQGEFAYLNFKSK